MSHSHSFSDNGRSHRIWSHPCDKTVNLYGIFFVRYSLQIPQRPFVQVFFPPLSLSFFIFLFLILDQCPTPLKGLFNHPLYIPIPFSLLINPRLDFQMFLTLYLLISSSGPVPCFPRPVIDPSSIHTSSIVFDLDGSTCLYTHTRYIHAR